MQETHEADHTVPCHDALAALGFAAESISLTITFPIGSPLDLADFSTECVSKEAVVELLDYAVDSLQDHETDRIERERIEKLIRENLDKDIKVEIIVNFAPCGESDMQ